MLSEAEIRGRRPFSYGLFKLTRPMQRCRIVMMFERRLSILAEPSKPHSDEEMQWPRQATKHLSQCSTPV